VFYFILFTHYVVWAVNRIRLLHYGATKKRMDNTEMPFSDLKHQRQKLIKNRNTSKNRHANCFSVFFHLISGPVLHLVFLKNEIKNGAKMRTVNTHNGKCKGEWKWYFLQGMFSSMTCRLMLTYKFYSLRSISCPTFTYGELPCANKKSCLVKIK